MDSHLVITVIARDRPGLVESLSAAVVRHKGNWLESRMSRLGGQFAGILRLTVPEEGKDNLVSELRGLEAGGLKLTIQPDQAPASEDAGRMAELSLVGQDRPGIVRQISQAFARGNVNVEKLETECSSAPMSGETMFHARAKVRIPPTCEIQTLREELEKIASDLMVDLKFAEIPVH